MAKWKLSFEQDLKAMADRNRRQVWMICGLTIIAIVGWML